MNGNQIYQAAKAANPDYTPWSPEPRKEPKVFNSLTVRKRPFQPRKITGKSIAVPDQGMSVRDILERHVKNGLPPIEKDVFDDSEVMSPFDGHPDRLDLTERQELLERSNETIKAYEAKLAEEEQQRLTEAENARIEAEVLRRLNDKSQGSVKDPV